MQVLSVLPFPRFCSVGAQVTVIIPVCSLSAVSSYQSYCGGSRFNSGADRANGAAVMKLETRPCGVTGIWGDEVCFPILAFCSMIFRKNWLSPGSLVSNQFVGNISLAKQHLYRCGEL